MSVMRRRNTGFTVLELLAAIFVISVVMTTFVALLVKVRRAIDVIEEQSLAAAVAQGALERLRRLPPDELVSGRAISSALPPEAGRLSRAKLTTTVSAWNAQPRLRHLRVELTWRSRDFRTRVIVREGLASDRRIR